MHGSGILVLLLVGLVAGWLAGQIVRGRGFGLVGDLIVGVVGAFIGSWLFGALGIFIGMGLIGAIISATIGAVILVAIIRLVRRV
ncbi:MAG: GlsB/YeaQ/YmgE family stress response membrane protein [Alphaproteobacteria bacterium]|nr:GlsB/YeaQ/YmgE family stress response membrane protein [Alphaproteobacteria bacterium]